MNSKMHGKERNIFLDNDTLAWGIGATMAYVIGVREKAAQILALRDITGVISGYADPGELSEDPAIDPADRAILREYLRIEPEIVKSRQESVEWAQEVWLPWELLLQDAEKFMGSKEIRDSLQIFDYKAGMLIFRETPHFDQMMDVPNLVNSYIDGYQNLMRLAKQEDRKRNDGTSSGSST